jgi:hypothetical protein
MATGPEEFISNIITNAITTASNQTDAASSAANQLIGESIGFYVEPPNSKSTFSVTAVEPEIPTVADSTLSYEAQLAKLIALLSDQLADFYAKYYPLVSDAFDEATSWLVSTITNGGTGVNAGVENQIWQRARERISSEGLKLENQLVTAFAAKGYTLVPGALIAKIGEVRFEAFGKIGEASTAIAAKQIEIEIETIKFAVGEALKSRFMAMQAAGDYIRAIATAPDAAAKVAGLNTDVQAKMMQAAAGFYEARLGRDKLVLTSKLAEMDSRDVVYKHRRDNAIQADNVKIQALSAAADVFARTASAALSSLNSIASTATNAFSA